MSQVDYKEAGVDITKADAFVERIKKLVPTTFNDQVLQGIGGFAAVYKLNDQKYLASCTDGVGTKLKIGQHLDKHHGIGIDLVAMCVNDLLCVGARPLFFLDYMAFGKLDTRISEELIAGMVDGCRQSGMALIGGETAEMPGIYKDGEYDLAGFSVGELTPSEMFKEEAMSEGDVLIGLASSGFHSNGYSLLRKLVKDSETELLEQLLIPTQIYVETFMHLRQKFQSSILAAAHMTGGGIHNIPRMSENFDYTITSWPSVEEMAPVFKPMLQRMDLSQEELFRTFNMGVGLTVLVKKAHAEAVMTELKGKNIKAWMLGHITRGSGQIEMTDWKL
ncbi:phosphoribosylformylglycinamidine cyclo-ligase [Bdellovibrio bacteriovorus]|uniref:Phosphoribosylformylglycinamidine cyclo-ligase n=1 Tax=Bdellovibrio bacteriovorus TaxID=959 RepID=A0A162GHS4_BDEBC|nr:phosphoribosylformylglycinamidine cyclo-ligase [Bdellovibrio bacteriovorus]KYG68181.1 phosphoribosylformylglycinamidine cyclo-ligase [Bdellovibrio bacteriovorus]